MSREWDSPGSGSSDERALAIPEQLEARLVDDAIRARKLLPADREWGVAFAREKGIPAFLAEMDRHQPFIDLDEIGSDEGELAIEIVQGMGAERAGYELHHAADDLDRGALRLIDRDYPGAGERAWPLANRDRRWLQWVAARARWLGTLAPLRSVKTRIKPGPKGPPWDGPTWERRYREADRAIEAREGRRPRDTERAAEMGLGRTAFYDYVKRYGEPA